MGREEREHEAEPAKPPTGQVERKPRQPEGTSEHATGKNEHQTPVGYTYALRDSLYASGVHSVQAQTKADSKTPTGQTMKKQKIVWSIQPGSPENRTGFPVL